MTVPQVEQRVEGFNPVGVVGEVHPDVRSLLLVARGVVTAMENGGDEEAGQRVLGKILNQIHAIKHPEELLASVGVAYFGGAHLGVDQRDHH